MLELLQWHDFMFEHGLRSNDNDLSLAVSIAETCEDRHSSFITCLCPALLRYTQRMGKKMEISQLLHKQET